MSINSFGGVGVKVTDLWEGEGLWTRRREGEGGGKGEGIGWLVFGTYWGPQI
jgi:hypothetical protein